MKPLYGLWRQDGQARLKFHHRWCIELGLYLHSVTESELEKKEWKENYSFLFRENYWLGWKIVWRNDSFSWQHAAIWNFSLCDFLINFPLIFSKRDRHPFQIIWSNDSFILKILRIDPCSQMEQDLWAGSRFWTSRVLLHWAVIVVSLSIYIWLNHHICM